MSELITEVIYNLCVQLYLERNKRGPLKEEKLKEEKLISGDSVPMVQLKDEPGDDFVSILEKRREEVANRQKNIPEKKTEVQQKTSQQSIMFHNYDTPFILNVEGNGKAEPSGPPSLRPLQKISKKEANKIQRELYDKAYKHVTEIRSMQEKRGMQMTDEVFDKEVSKLCTELLNSWEKDFEKNKK